MEEKIKNWYTETFPDDEFGKEINPDITFGDAYCALARKRSFYGCIGVGDSVVRERIFKKLADVHGCTYDVIYDMWL